MAAATPIGALPDKLAALARSIDQARRVTVTDMGLVAKDEFLAGPPRVGLPRTSSLKWGAGFDIRGTRRPTGLVKYRGPVHWTEYGTAPHIITPKGFAGSRASRTARAGSFDIASRSTGNRLSAAKVAGGAAKAVRYGGKIRRVAYHPGTSPRPFWDTVKSRTAKQAPEVLRSGLRRNMATAGFRNASQL